MNFGFFVGISLFTAIGALLLRQYNQVYAVALTVAGGCAIVFGCMGYVREITDFIRELLEYSGIESEWIWILLKALGICWLCQFGTDLCRDAGETAMAGYVETAGKIMTVALALPMMSQIVKTILNLLDL